MSDICIKNCENMLADVYMAKTCLGLYEQTLGYDPRPSEMKDQFFYFSNRCYLYTLMMLLSKTYDRHKDAKSLTKFLDTVEKNNPLDIVGAQIGKDRELLSSLSSDIEFLIALRNKFYAHNGTTDRNQLRMTAPLTTRKIKNLVDCAEKILKYYYRLFNSEVSNEAWHYNDYVIADFKNIKSQLEHYFELYLRNLENGISVSTPQDVNRSDHE